MPFVSSPGVPIYRITLFYGPESVPSVPNTLQCVFNVKKRSWKGGVQIVVAVEEAQLARMGNILHLERWLHGVLSEVPQDEYSDYALRGHDLFVQQVCHLKLQLAIQQGIRQENSRLDSKMLWQELDQAIIREATAIKDQILAGLDIGPSQEV